MIEGKRVNGDIIPAKLHNAFAILNYAIESCIQGSNFAYSFDTNYIINNIYNNLPPHLKTKEYVVDKNIYSNGFYYFKEIFDYIGMYDININFIEIDEYSTSYEDFALFSIDSYVQHSVGEEPLDIIVFFCNKILHYNDETNGELPNMIATKPLEFEYKGMKYKLDSCILRDNSKQIGRAHV